MEVETIKTIQSVGGGEASVNFVESFPGFHAPPTVFKIAQVVGLCHYHLQPHYMHSEELLGELQYSHKELLVESLLKKYVSLDSTARSTATSTQRRDNDSVELWVSLWGQPNCYYTLQFLEQLRNIFLSDLQRRLCLLRHYPFRHMIVVLWLPLRTLCLFGLLAPQSSVQPWLLLCIDFADALIQFLKLFVLLVLIFFQTFDADMMQLVLKGLSADHYVLSNHSVIVVAFEDLKAICQQSVLFAYALQNIGRQSILNLPCEDQIINNMQMICLNDSVDLLHLLSQNGLPLACALPLGGLQAQVGQKTML